MIFNRTFNALDALSLKSHFLLGPRGTGKSYLIKQQLEGKCVIINLLRSEFARILLADHSKLESIIRANLPIKSNLVVIDEIQKIPGLLDEVHRLIEESGYHFLLTGSSARKLKAKGVNLLAGRAWPMGFFPLTSHEMGSQFDLATYLRYGGLPSVVQSNTPELELDAYVQMYLQEEIKAEGLIRKLAPFSEFLRLAGLSNGKIINFSSLANQVGVSSPTIREYFHIIEDTLTGYLIHPHRTSPSRKPSSASRFYFFDPGVANTLAEIKHLDPASDLFGRNFEQFIYMELKAWLTYNRKKSNISYWQKDNIAEVDFLLGEDLAIEVKASSRISSYDLKGLKLISKELPLRQKILVSRDPIPQEIDGILCLPWQDFCQRLWDNRLLP